ncbi:metacaspase-2 [Bicyclus anynana]|uniref:Metacaspase-2 n=1 Tax=Bicyclus anynana TaxID=110368 RepID=A0ABM3M1U6_BICAN|nr:metacaspase-2 [Bicyclus anynana]
MDDTQASNKSTTDAGAKRKRRSSILKSQRPPRTPLSELEFNVATPTDTAKSRRVSFSRRTGVAEFVTNEATTTWKNFYEEHNKSLETSGNESVANAPRQMSIGHIGKRIFDQQFEEVEIVDIGGTLQPKTLAQDFHSSLNNLNITQQLAMLECPSEDRKLTAPHQNFELSAFTDHQSKVFGDDLSIPVMPEMSNPISINFSLQTGNLKDNCDDLDEIVKDLERSQVANVVCSGPGPFNSDNMSEYIEVDLNMTHVAIKNDVCEMSITDTIHNPEVQEVSKSISSVHSERKVNNENDWMVDKENIAINPYTMPKESKHFNINESSDKILVFDGKKLTVKSERETIFEKDSDNKDNFRKTLLPDLPTGATPKRKTIVLNTNDDLPNFLSDNLSKSIQGVDNFKDVPTQTTNNMLKQSVIYDECDLSITQPLSNAVEVPKRKTIVFQDDMGNISITQAVPATVIINKKERRKTIIYESDNANISVTQVVPTNIMVAHDTTVEKKKTVVYEEDISFTQALPSNLILNNDSNTNKTMYYQDDNDISVTQVIPQNILDVMKNKKNSNISNISITQAIPSEILVGNVKLTDSLATHKYGANEDEEIEITQAVTDNILLSDKSRSEKRRTMVFEDVSGDISVTQAVPANVIFDTFNTKCDTKAKSLESDENIALTKSTVNSVIIKTDIPTNNNQDGDIENTSNKSRTIVYNQGSEEINTDKSRSEKRRTIVFEDDAGDISVTQAVPANVVFNTFGTKLDTKIKSLENDENIALNKSTKNCDIENTSTRRRTIIYNEDADNLSMTHIMSSNIIVTKPSEIEKMHISSDHDMTDISMTRPLPTNIFVQNVVKEELSNLSLGAVNNSSKLSDLNKNENKDVTNQLIDENKSKRQSELRQSIGGNLSMTKPIAGVILDIHKEITVNDSEICAEKSFHVTTADLIKNNLSIKQDILIYQAAEHSITQSEIDSNVQFVPSNSESGVKVSKKSLVSNEDSIKNDSYVKASTHYSNSNDINENNIIENQSLINEFVSKDNCVKKQNINSNSDKNVNSKKSFLNELLDMSNASLENVRKSFVSNIEPQMIVEQLTIDNIRSNNEEKSSESIFVITKDSEDCVNDNAIKNEHSNIPEKLETSEPKQIVTEPVKTIECTEDTEDAQDLQSKITELKAYNEQNSIPNNRHYERVISADVSNDGESLNEFEMKEQITRNNILSKSIRNADNTRDLLGMLSDFTEEANDEVEKDESTTDFTEEANDEVEKDEFTTDAKDNLAIENKIEHCEPRLSLIPKRRSIVLSREDLLHNLSMAQAVLQQSRFEIDDDESLEETQDSLEETQDSPEKILEEEKSHRKSVRISDDIVKTLQFEEDESIVSDATQKFYANVSPLKKTAFGETSYMREDKARVIPTYLKDVSDNIKALMTDLVKPTADVMPFESSNAKSCASTCSTEMQANLITSSQIDVDIELHSNTESIENIQNVRTRQSPVRVMIEKPASPNKGNKVLSRSIQSESISLSMDIDHTPILQTCMKHPIPKSNVKDTTIVFDHDNPLNNVLLAPIDNVNVHKYNPIKSTETMHSEHDIFTQMSHEERKIDKVVEIERFSTHYKVDNALRHSTLQSGDNVRQNANESKCLISNISKTFSVDCSTDKLSEVRSTEVNTLIAMKANKELLEASSSLTLVDDTVTRSEFDIEIHNKTSEEVYKNTSPVKVIYKMETDEDVLQEIDSDALTNFETDDDSKSNYRKSLYSPSKQNESTGSDDALKLNTKCKDKTNNGKQNSPTKRNNTTDGAFDTDSDKSITRKRSYSPRKVNEDTDIIQIDVTPKPVNKMQKISNSPRVQMINDPLDTLLNCVDNMDSLPNMDIDSPSCQTKAKSHKKSPRSVKVVQHVSTEYDKETHKNKTLEDINSVDSVESMDTLNTFASSNRGNVNKVPLCEKSSNPSSDSSIYWQTDDSSSHNLECSSSFNVVDKINVLKFMGRDCEWESACSDVWMFRLLRSRIRITVRLSHRHHNASRSRVLADTPLESVTVEPIPPEVSDPLAALCVRLSAQAMCAECEGAGSAARVPGVLRRCARVSRVALRWARAMRDTRARLAYNVDADGQLTLKVANVPLRAVWEVRLRLALAHACAGAYVRAEDVRARDVLAGPACAPEPAVARFAASMPQDWRHAPATIWSVFRYLKNKTVDDDCLGL